MQASGNRTRMTRIAQMTTLDDPRFSLVTYRLGASAVPTPVLRGTGIRVQTVLIAVQHWGMTPVEIAEDYGVPVKQVEEALAFVAEHHQEISADLYAEQKACS